MALFGRKKSPVIENRLAYSEKDGHQGHQAVLRHLDDNESGEPGLRERLAGRIIFDLALQILADDDRRVRMEDLFALLASVGGQQCMAPIIRAAPAGATFDGLGLKAIKGNDGRLYLFGDPPNRLLLESEDALLSLAFGAAHALGAPVTMAMIHDEMRKVASRIGGPDFDTLDLPGQHMVDSPMEWARLCGAKISDALDLYQVPAMRRATAIGYAIQKAFESGAQSIDPMVGARIVVQCACRTSKVLIS